MSTLSDRLADLPAPHREALEWFAQRTGQLIGWPEPLDGLFLVNRPKGIHKPTGWQHALSVRQSLKGPYADRPPRRTADGAWTYEYFQEGQNPADRDKYATNRGLVACMNDDVPVAVLIQEMSKPRVQYRVMGLARVVDWRSGHFTLAGYDGTGALPVPTHPDSPNMPYEVRPPSLASAAEQYEPLSLEDARQKIDAQITLRQGGKPFRDAALERFNRRCALSGCDVTQVLEAAHIVPYLGTHTNAPDNALLLRADLHTLFDRELLSIDPGTLTVVLSATLADSEYAGLSGRNLEFGASVNREALRSRLIERRTILEDKKRAKA